MCGILTGMAIDATPGRWPWGPYMEESMTDIEQLRKVATGEITVPEFSPKDWRPGSIALLLWNAADTIEELRSLAGKADVGPSFAEVTKELRRAAPEG